MRDEEKRVLERVHTYCSYGVLVITICFCALIYWGNQQLGGQSSLPNANQQELYNQQHQDIFVSTTNKLEQSSQTTELTSNN